MHCDHKLTMYTLKICLTVITKLNCNSVLFCKVRNVSYPYYEIQGIFEAHEML